MAHKTFLLSKPAGEIDKVLQPWKEFLSSVIAFGECDGTARISVLEGHNPWYDNLPLVLKYYPPNFALYINRKGKEQDLKEMLDREEAEEEARTEGFLKLTDKQIKELIEKDRKAFWKEYFGKDDRRIHWVVDCKSTLVGSRAKIPVRHGFRTVIISESLESAMNRTEQLWRAEAARTDEEKYGDLDRGIEVQDDRPFDQIGYGLALAQADDSMKPLLELVEDPYEDKEILFSPENQCKVLELISWFEGDLKDLKKKYRKLLRSPVASAYKEFQQELDRIDAERDEEVKRVGKRSADSWRVTNRKRDKIEAKFKRTIHKLPEVKLCLKGLEKKLASDES